MRIKVWKNVEEIDKLKGELLEKKGNELPTEKKPVEHQAGKCIKIEKRKETTRGDGINLLTATNRRRTIGTEFILKCIQKS